MLCDLNLSRKHKLRILYHICTSYPLSSGSGFTAERSSSVESPCGEGFLWPGDGLRNCGDGFLRMSVFRLLGTGGKSDKSISLGSGFSAVILESRDSRLSRPSALLSLLSRGGSEKTDLLEKILKQVYNTMQNSPKYFSISHITSQRNF